MYAGCQRYELSTKNLASPDGGRCDVACNGPDIKRMQVESTDIGAGPVICICSLGEISGRFCSRFDGQRFAEIDIFSKVLAFHCLARYEILVIYLPTSPP